MLRPRWNGMKPCKIPSAQASCSPAPPGLSASGLNTGRWELMTLQWLYLLESLQAGSSIHRLSLITALFLRKSQEHAFLFGSSQLGWTGHEMGHIKARNKWVFLMKQSLGPTLTRNADRNKAPQRRYTTRKQKYPRSIKIWCWGLTSNKNWS